VTAASALKERLAPLAPVVLELADDSAEHAGHAGAAGGGGHFSLLIVSEHFEGLTRLARHRAVLDRVGDLIPFPVHALAIRAYTPDEFPS
jgi:BolA protein